METKSGYVTIVGMPNAGKSTLLNSLMGQKLSIITDKPQTTRKKILGILTEENYQIIFLDTPGIVKPSYLLQEKMLYAIEDSIRDAEVLICIFDIVDDPQGRKLLENEHFIKVIEQVKVPRIALINKIDLVDEAKVEAYYRRLETLALFQEILPVSAKLGAERQKVLDTILNYLPEHPKYYPDEYAAEEPERFFVAELIREQIFTMFREEIPYSCEVLIDEFKERDSSKDYISALVIVERDSQKRIIIGKKGSAIKELGAAARKKIEEFLEREVYLELRVKVKENWRSNESALKQFGYTRPKD